MKKIATSIIALALCVVVAAPAMSANAVRFSMVYGGGGSANSAALYQRDFVELFNSSGAAVNIGGWTVEYGSATGLWGSSAGNIYTFPAGTMIQPCSYLFLAMGSAGTGGAAFPVTPDFDSGTSGPNMSASSGKVGLFMQTNSSVACGAEVGLVDKVGWGASNCPEVANVTYAGGNLDLTLGIVRGAAGMTDTDNNAADCVAVTGVVPRNSASPSNPDCLVVPAPSSSWGKIKTMYR